MRLISFVPAFLIILLLGGEVVDGAAGVANTQANAAAPTAEAITLDAEVAAAVPTAATINCWECWMEAEDGGKWTVYHCQRCPDGGDDCSPCVKSNTDCANESLGGNDAPWCDSHDCNPAEEEEDEELVQALLTNEDAGGLLQLVQVQPQRFVLNEQRGVVQLKDCQGAVYFTADMPETVVVALGLN